jgi:hypothetical protein
MNIFNIYSAFMKCFGTIILVALTVILFAPPAVSIEAQWVTVEGFAALENVTKQEARQLAIEDALRAAVEKIVGVNLISETLVINNEVSGDVIYTIPYGKVVAQEVIQENVELTLSENRGEAPYLTYKVKMKVQVAEQKGKADPFFKVGARINRTVFKEGDQIELRITPTKDAYISVFNVLPDETVLILVPNRFRQNNFVTANSTLVFPDVHDRTKGISLEAFVGEGRTESKEMFHILALKEPMKFDTATFSEGVFGIYSGSSGLVSDLVKQTVHIPLSQRAEAFIYYRIEK